MSAKSAEVNGTPKIANSMMAISLRNAFIEPLHARLAATRMHDIQKLLSINALPERDAELSSLETKTGNFVRKIIMARDV